MGTFVLLVTELFLDNCSSSPESPIITDIYRLLLIYHRFTAK